MAAASDVNLVFGMIALQCDFITKEQLLAGMQAWIFDKSKSLGDLLVQQNALAADTRQLLDALVRKHLSQHDDDPQRSLAAISSRASAEHDLAGLHDPDIHQTLAAVQGLRSVRPAPADELATIDPPDADGRFRILRPHAKGGLGVVYVAHDREVNRQVALKEIQFARAGDPDSRARFLLEAEITGGLEHPGIVPIYGLGTYADGRPYYAMRFIQGDSLKDAVDRFHAADKPGRDATERDLALRQLLRRFIDVCNAIDYAHSKGVLHRDLKPGNIMLGKFGETLVVDWGLAKATGVLEPGRSRLSTEASEAPLRPASSSGSDPTQMGSAIGTPAFMSPEQAEGRLDLLGPATDVYSLGATLYYVLTGKAAFEGDLLQVLDAVRKGAFPKPRQAKSAIDEGLEAVCLKAMARPLGDRYVSASALRKDVENWVADAPVEARPDPLRVKMRRWLVRNKVVAAATFATTLVGAAFLAILAFVNAQAYDRERTLAASEGAAKVTAESERRSAFEAKEQAEKQKAFADEQAKIARQQTALAQKRTEELTIQMRKEAAMTALAASQELQMQHPTAAAALLDRIPKIDRGWEWNYLRRALDGSYATLYGHTDRVTTVAFSHDDRWLVSGDVRGTVKVWDSRTGAEVHRLLRTLGIGSIAFSFDDAQIAIQEGFRVTLWDAASWTKISETETRAFAFHPKTNRLATGVGGIVRLWDSRSGQQIKVIGGSKEEIAALAYSPDGSQLALHGQFGDLRMVNAESGNLVRVLFDTSSEDLVLEDVQKEANAPSDPKTKPDPKRESDPAPNGPIPNQQEPDKSPKKTSSVSPRESSTVLPETEFVSLPSPLLDNPVEAATGALLIMGGATRRMISFSPDGNLLAVHRDQVELWDAHSGKVLRTLIGTSDVTSFAFSPDGAWLSCASGDGTIKIWDVAKGSEVHRCMGHKRTATSVAFSPDGQRMASGGDDGTVKLWAGWRIQGGFPGYYSDVLSIAFTSDGNRVVIGTGQGVEMRDVFEGSVLWRSAGHSNEVTTVAVSPDDRHVISGSADKTMKLWDLRTGNELATFRGHTAGIQSVAFSSDGRFVASGSRDHSVRLWNATTGTEIATFRDHENVVNGVRFFPDGRLASASDDGTIKIWTTDPPALKSTLHGHAKAVTFLEFIRSGTQFVSGSADQSVKIWDAANLSEVAQFRTGSMGLTAISPDGRWLAISGGSSVRLLDRQIGAEGIDLSGASFDMIWTTAFSPDGSRLFAGGRGKDGSLFIAWDSRPTNEVLILQGHTHVVTSAAFNHDGSRLASGSFDESAKIWDTKTGEEIATVRTPASAVQAVAFSPDARRLVTASCNSLPKGDGWKTTLKVWDTQTWKEIHSLASQTKGVVSVAFCPDGQRIVVNDAGTAAAEIWDPNRGERLPVPADFKMPEAQQRHPSLPVIAVADGGVIRLIRTDAKAEDMAIRSGAARFDEAWHASRFNHDSSKFSKAFHLGRLLAVDASNGSRSYGHVYWNEFFSLAEQSRTVQFADDIMDRLVRESPSNAPLLTQRATFRFRNGRFAESYADEIAVAALSASNRLGWPEWARHYQGTGDQTASNKEWEGAIGAFAAAAKWAPVDASHLHRLAWACAGAGDASRFRAAVRKLDSLSATGDNSEVMHLSAALCQGLCPFPTLLRGDSPLPANAVMNSIRTRRDHDLVYTACLRPDHGLDADRLLERARKNVDESPTAANRETYGAALCRAGKTAEAVTVLEKLRSEQKNKAGVWTKLFLAMAYLKQGDAATAQSLVRSSVLSGEPGWEERLILDSLGEEIARVLGPASPSPSASKSPSRKESAPQGTLVIAADPPQNSALIRIGHDGSRERLSRDNANYSSPAWSPDGKTIAFDSDRDGTRQIYVMVPDNNVIRKLTNGTVPSLTPSWSRDGKTIAFQRNLGAGPHIFLVAVDGSGEKQICGGYDPALSPDGSKVLFAAREGKEYRLSALEVPGGKIVRLPANVNVFGYVHPAWSPDGNKIAWTDEANGSLQLFVADADGRNVKQLTHEGVYNNERLSWSPDAKRNCIRSFS